MQRDWACQRTVLLGFVQGRLVQFLKWLRLLVIAYLALGWVAGSDSPLVGLARLVLECALLVWVVVFWRRMRARVAEGLPQSEHAPSRGRLMLVWSLSYLVAGGGLLMELVGYRALAGHWLVSWAQTLLLGIWAHLGWRVIQEWYAAQKAAPRSREETGLPAVAAE